MGSFEGNEGKRFGVDCAPTNRLVVGVVNFLDRKHGKTYRQILYICLVNQIIAIMSEILARIPKNLTSSPVLGEKKEWVLGAASLALGIGSSLFGANKAKKAARRAQAENQYRTNAEKAWYDKNYNTDYLDTKAGQNLMRRAQEVQDEYIRKADGAAAVGGGTAASVAQAKESANKAMGDTIANIAAQDTSRKQHVEDAHLANTQQLSRERQQIEQQKAQNTSDAAQNASNALFNFGVNQLGSELEGTKLQNNSKLANSTPTLDNKNVTDISTGLSHKADANGLLNPNASNSQLAGGTMLDEAVGNLNKKKPKVPHLGV